MQRNVTVCLCGKVAGTVQFSPLTRSSVQASDLHGHDADSYLDDGHISLPVIVRAVSLADGVGLNDVKWQQILKTREHYEVDTVVTLISYQNFRILGKHRVAAL